MAYFAVATWDWTAARDELDSDKLIFRDLVENLCASAGVKHIGSTEADLG